MCTVSFGLTCALYEFYIVQGQDSEDLVLVLVMHIATHAKSRPKLNVLEVDIFYRFRF